MASIENETPEYIWIAGTSGVGKATCIRKLLDETNISLRRLFDISDAAHAYGLGFEDDSFGSLLNTQSGQVIIKWQFRTHKNVKRVMAAKPTAGHRAFLLWRPFDIQIEDLHRRSPESKDTMETLLFDWGIVKRLFARLQKESGLNVSVIDVHAKPFIRLKDWP